MEFFTCLTCRVLIAFLDHVVSVLCRIHVALLDHDVSLCRRIHVTSDTFGGITCYLVCLRAMIREFFSCFSCIRFCFRFLYLRCFFTLCYFGFCRLSGFSSLSITSWYLFFEPRFFLPGFFVCLFSDVLLCCIELVFVCLTEVVFLRSIDHECSHDTTVVAAHVDSVIGFGVFAVFQVPSHD